MKKFLKPEILVPLLIVVAVLALVVYSGSGGDMSLGGHTHGGSTHTH